ncbi:SurA N-terminal domain-containing protein [uncultured Desulfosarcina sp.]|uniref:SurA N-terminal domain-containing protein n=1 Tax=uncultured Desulfosarcina sp. TaxID=218289 RepID=UPI0029C83555|nr:SurA N-terminal domain-containing protein [uncultured Desulfosarcina sp.]
MLNVMRKHAGSWMIKVILFAIVIVFVFWGVGSFRSRQASKVATVNDEIIAVSEFRRAYNNLIEQYRQRFGENLNDGMLEMLKVKDQALNQLIDRALVLQEAKKLELRVTDAEVAESIMNAPVFQTNGSFDNRRYLRLLAQVHLTPEEFEADQKNALLAEKLTRVVAGAAKVSDGEARLWYDWQNASANIDTVLFEPGRYTDITPSEQEIADYFDEQKENYKTEPMVKARYVLFDPDAFKGEVAVAEDEIADYYDSNIDEFKTEKTVEASHILIKLAPDADEEADAAARSKAADIAKMAREGKDFAELAKTYSEGPTKDKGGYLGKFQKSQMVKPFADKAFSMASGEISDPVKTQFGWHVIKVESVEDATTRTLEESKDRIIATLKQRKARNLAYDRAEQFYETCYEKEDLIHNAETFNLAVLEAGSFTRKGPEALGSAKSQFAQAAFDLGKDGISDIQDIGGRYYIIQTTEVIKAAIPELDAVKARVRKDLIRKMQAEKAYAEAKAMAADLASGKTFEESASLHGVTIKHTGLFKRNTSIPDIGSDPQVTQAAFQLASSGDISKEPIKGGAGYYLLRLVEKKAPAADGFESEKESIKAMLLQQKQRNAMQDWIDARKASSDIKIEKSYLE